MHRLTFAAISAATLIAAGVAASAYATASPQEVDHVPRHGVPISSCPSGFRYQRVSVPGYTIFTCAKADAPRPGVATVTVTAGQLAAAITSSPPTTTVTAIQTQTVTVTQPPTTTWTPHRTTMTVTCTVSGTSTSGC
jgi:hypothetical protein